LLPFSACTGALFQNLQKKGKIHKMLQHLNFTQSIRNIYMLFSLNFAWNVHLCTHWREATLTKTWQTCVSAELQRGPIRHNRAKTNLQLKRKNSLFTLQTFHYNYYWWSITFPFVHYYNKFLSPTSILECNSHKIKIHVY
jgi:hypothetical protein